MTTEHKRFAKKLLDTMTDFEEGHTATLREAFA